MVRLLAALVTLPALVAGLVVTPHSHIHPAGASPVQDAHHRHLGGAAVRHAHPTPHGPAASSRAAIAEAEIPQGDHDHRHPVALSTGEFAPRVVNTPQAPPPLVLAWVASPAAPTPRVIRPTALQPPSHGPPEAPPAPSRAPPVALPAAA
jgi:hypothetical protein